MIFEHEWGDKENRQLNYIQNKYFGRNEGFIFKYIFYKERICLELGSLTCCIVSDQWVYKVYRLLTPVNTYSIKFPLYVYKLY